MTPIRTIKAKLSKVSIDAAATAASCSSSRAGTSSDANEDVRQPLRDPVDTDCPPSSDRPANPSPRGSPSRPHSNSPMMRALRPRVRGSEGAFIGAVRTGQADRVSDRMAEQTAEQGTEQGLHREAAA
jgi:hypothetical protein